MILSQELKQSLFFQLTSLLYQTKKKESHYLDCLENKEIKNPFLHLKSKAVRNTLIATIESLPDKQKLVLSLYYYEDLNLKEIGKILNVTESRISQLHTQAVETLRNKLKSLLVE